MAFLDQILAFLNTAGGLTATIALVLEFILRVIPSEKPLSVLHLIGGFITKLGQVLIGIGDFLDKILPQKLT